MTNPSMAKVSIYMLTGICGVFCLSAAMDLTSAFSNDFHPILAADASHESGDPITDHIMTPIAQLGFAGAFALASALVWWFARTRREDWNVWHAEQLKSIEKTSAVITLNTEAHVRVVDALAGLTVKMTELGLATTHLTEELIGRPCLLKEREK